MILQSISLKTSGIAPNIIKRNFGNDNFFNNFSLLLFVFLPYSSLAYYYFDPHKMMTFYEWCEYYWGVTSDITGELPLYWYDRIEPIEDEC